MKTAAALTNPGERVMVHPLKPATKVRAFPRQVQSRCDGIAETTQVSKTIATGRATSRDPITWTQVDRWLSWRDMYYEEGKTMRGVDKRLLTIAPPFIGVLVGRRGYAEAGKQKQVELLGIARRALESRGSTFAHADNRTRVVCDWMFRCALPLWLDRLPKWASGGAWARTIRETHPILWTANIVWAMNSLTPIWLYLDGAGRDRGTGDERIALNVAHEKSQEVMQVLSCAVTRALHFGQGSGDGSWLNQMAMRVVRGEGHEDDAAVASTVPQLVDVMLTVQPGDSLGSVGERCVWEVPSTKRRLVNGGGL